MGSPAWEIINEIFVALERQQHLKPVMDVFDAAMAAHEARGKCDTLANKLSPEHERITAEELAEKAEVALYLACRRAKEGRGLDGKDDLPLVRALERAKEGTSGDHRS